MWVQNTEKKGRHRPRFGLPRKGGPTCPVVADQGMLRTIRWTRREFAMTTATGQPLLLIIATLALLLSLAACDNGSDISPDIPSDNDDPASAHGAGEATDPAADSAASNNGNVRPVPKKLSHQTETLERRPEGCDDDDCPVFEARLPVYEGQPELNAAVRRQLTSQLVAGGENPTTPESLEAAADRFLAIAGDESTRGGQGWELSGSASQVGRWGDLVTIAVSSYEFTGGAHGMPVTRWLNWDLADNRAVPLGRVIEPGQEEAFWAAVTKAHQRWLDKHAPSGGAQPHGDTFRRDWPFQQTDTYRLSDDGVVLHYDVYSIAPYAMGQPELTIPWSDLDGVIRARYRPE